MTYGRYCLFAKLHSDDCKQCVRLNTAISTPLSGHRKCSTAYKSYWGDVVVCFEMTEPESKKINVHLWLENGIVQNVQSEDRRKNMSLLTGIICSYVKGVLTFGPGAPWFSWSFEFGCFASSSTVLRFVMRSAFRPRVLHPYRGCPWLILFSAWMNRGVFSHLGESLQDLFRFLDPVKGSLVKCGVICFCLETECMFNFGFKRALLTCLGSHVEVEVFEWLEACSIAGVPNLKHYFVSKLIDLIFPDGCGA